MDEHVIVHSSVESQFTKKMPPTQAVTQANPRSESRVGAGVQEMPDKTCIPAFAGMTHEGSAD